MSFLPDTLTRSITDFQGPWDPNFVDVTTIPLPKGQIARNVRYSPGMVSTRFGLTAMFTDALATAGYSSMFNWLFLATNAPRNFLLAFAPHVGLQMQDLHQLSTAPQTLIADTTSKGASIASAGRLAFAAFFDANGMGTGGGNIFGYPIGAFGFLPTVDPLFAGPLVSPPVITESGMGVTTAGLHRFGYICTTRNGFTGKWSPAPGDQFQPYEFTSAGGTILQFSLTASFPSDLASFQVFMTTVANPNRYYLVPGAVVGLPGAAVMTTFNATINITDEDLTATGEDATPYESLLTQSVAGTPPFRPQVIFPYSSRMAYVTVDQSGFPVVYFSDPNNYQSLTADDHSVYLPGNLQIVTGQYIRGVCYLFGPHWTFSVADTGDVPALWATPQLVDGSIGTPSPFGVYANSSQNFAWVAATSGLYLFQGAIFPQRPVSYYQTPDWNRINWNAATAVRVIDDEAAKRVSVLAPLDGATTPTHTLTWDYTLGTDPESVHYSLDYTAGYSLGAHEMVESPSTRKLERWTAPSGGGQPVARTSNVMDAQPHRDIASPIDAIYLTALFPGQDGQKGILQQFHAVNTRIKGQGKVTLTALAMDGVKKDRQRFLTLSDTPGKEFTNRFYMRNYGTAIQIEQNQLDGYFHLSGLEVAYTLVEEQG